MPAHFNLSIVADHNMSRNRDFADLSSITSSIKSKILNIRCFATSRTKKEAREQPGKASVSQLPLMFPLFSDLFVPLFCFQMLQSTMCSVPGFLYQTMWFISPAEAFPAMIMQLYEEEIITVNVSCIVVFFYCGFSYDLYCDGGHTYTHTG
ncbi:hypothetical protein AMECASPLE_006221 [Ameca splendens]|uniref:Uncharacterized protein n=1 Tax=Ameca splendens TaxID=208324 RepID=A0ABV0YY23_9TELE